MTAVLAILLAACSAFDIREVQLSDTLYFGTGRPNGGVVSDAEWRTFVDDTITPRFPGFTEWIADGHWKSEHEVTHVVQIVHPEHLSDNRAVHEIIDAYKKRFQQETVFWVRGRVTTLLP
jgi:hypothetical protein